MIKLLLLLTLGLNICYGFEVEDPVFDIEDMEHENKGCPINSICSKTAGQMRINFNQIIKEINAKPQDKIKKLNNFLKETGLPLIFLTDKNAQKTIDPIMWNSSCKLHNSKNPNNAIMKAEKFLKEIRPADQMIFNPLRVYLEKTEIDLFVPFQSSLVMLDGDKVITINDFEDMFYQLSINPSGKLNVTNYSSKEINDALSKKISDVKCPKEMDVDSDYYQKAYCSKLWDIKAKKLRTIQFAWACP